MGGFRELTVWQPFFHLNPEPCSNACMDMDYVIRHLPSALCHPSSCKVLEPSLAIG
jgi:hypothetical protein